MAELFANYELDRRAPRWQNLVRLVGGSFALHVIFVLCALYVPAIRDAMYIASAFSGAGFSDEAYNKTHIGERATIINLADRFRYPEGYFASETSLPYDKTGLEIIQTANTLPAPVAPVPIIIKKSKPIVEEETTPTLTPSPSPSPSPTASVASSEAESDRMLDQIAAQNGIKRPKTVNKRPFVDLVTKYKKMKDDGQLDLSGTIEMTVEADRNEDGTLSNAEVTQKAGDERLKQAAMDFIAAISDSGMLDFLTDTKHLTLTLKLTENEVIVSATSEVDTEVTATRLARGYNLMLAAGQIAKRGRDEEVLFKSTKATSSGKQVIVNFTMPRKDAGDMLTKLSISQSS